MMGSSPVANPVCWGSIIAIPLNLTIPAGHGQTACIRNISAPQRSQYTASTFGRLTVVAGVHGRVGESGDFGMSGL